MIDWLDTETKSLLQPSPPEKLAPPDTASFALVLLAHRGHDHRALVGAVQRAAQTSVEQAELIASRRLPIAVRRGLTYSDAQIGQFELICCDSISVFLDDGVAADGDRQYLRELYAQLRTSPEFQPVSIAIRFIPDTDAGRRFCDQFLSSAVRTTFRYGSEIALLDRVFRKKARLMALWASEIGAKMAIDD